ncbi:hypothetical protein A2U01_0045189, partial [Trifolium medium]|nr:hypothetical protein [Trifolium medium]
MDENDTYSSSTTMDGCETTVDGAALVMIFEVLHSSSLSGCAR